MRKTRSQSIPFPSKKLMNLNQFNLIVKKQETSDNAQETIGAGDPDKKDRLHGTEFKVSSEVFFEKCESNPP